MSKEQTLFDLFGGVRPTARALDELPQTVAAWKRVGRIPAEKQPRVLATGLKLGLPITAEHVVFPLGQPYAAYADLPSMDAPVLCDRSHESQPSSDAVTPKGADAPIH